MASKQFMTAREAASLLGVRVETIYAYVSRGLLRSEPAGSAQRRIRRYHRDDVMALLERQESRRQPARVAAQALHFGSPVLDSSITLIADGNFYYRGRNVLELAGTVSVEAVASLIWSSSPEDDWFDGGGQLPPQLQRLRAGSPTQEPYALFQTILPIAAAEDWAAFDLRSEAVEKTGRRIMTLLTNITSGGMRDCRSIPEALALGWGLTDGVAEQLIRQALILCADHELNLSSFTARCVASGRATPYAAVAAGLAALQGARHGGFAASVIALLNEVARSDGARGTLTARLQRGEIIPGFVHPLYPDGDPRGRFLCDALQGYFPENEGVQVGAAIIQEVESLLGNKPTLDFGLAMLEKGLGLPAGSALTLFALGRTMGWIGHALEQYATGRMIRPRARYVGESPWRQ